MKEELFEQVTNFIEKGNFAEAKSLLETDISDEEKDMEALKLLGLCNVNLNLYVEAKSNFETVIKYCPEDATSWFYLALSYDNLEEDLHAISAYKEVIKLRDRETEAYKCLCVLYMKNDNPEEAIRCGKKALEFVKEDYSLYYIVGTAYMACKSFEESVYYLEKALELDPEHAQLYNNLGTTYLTIGNSEKAYENYKRASELDPDNAITYFNIASVLQIQNKHEEACEYFEKAYSLEPNDNYLSAHALSLVKIQRWEEAIKKYKVLAAHHPEKQTYQYNLACCYEESGDYKNAINILARLVAMNPKSVSMARKLANIFIKTHQPMLAKEIYERLMLLGNVGFEVFYEFAHLCLVLKDSDKAEKILKKVIELNPKYAQAHMDLGVIYLSKRLLDYAQDEFETALDIEPDNPEIIREYANFLHAVSEFEKADEYYAKALSIDNKAYVTYAFSALNKMFLKQYDEALEQINIAVSHLPHNGFFLYIAGKIRFLKEDYEDAKNYLIKSFELDDNIETKNLLGMCYYELENYEQAKNIFKSILSINEYNINILFWLAKCENKIGNTEKALEYLEKAVDISPEFEDAQQMIREIS